MSRVDQARQRAAALADENDARGLTPAGWLKPLPPFDIATNVEAFSLEDVAVAEPVSQVRPRAVEPPDRKVDVRTVLDRSSLGPHSLDQSVSHKVVVDPHMSPASREQYRVLAAALHNARAATGVRVVMITSAVAGEGKTLTAANLALTFSESYRRRVLLVDADLRSPTLHVLFGIDNSTGLSDGLASPERKTLRVQQVTPRLGVLTTGPRGADPMAGLTSERMDRLLQEARETFDWIVIDTPPVALLPDANLLASKVDGTVLVVKAQATPLELVQRAVAAIGKAKMLGVVLNAAHARPRTHDYPYRRDQSDDPSTVT